MEDPSECELSRSRCLVLHFLFEGVSGTAEIRDLVVDENDASIKESDGLETGEKMAADGRVHLHGAHGLFQPMLRGHVRPGCPWKAWLESSPEFGYANAGRTEPRSTGIAEKSPCISVECALRLASRGRTAGSVGSEPRAQHCIVSR